MSRSPRVERADAVKRHFRDQAEACERLGSPFTARLLRLVADHIDERSEIGQVLLGWPGDASADALSLRLAGALHALVLGRRSPPLAECYPPSGWSDHLSWNAVSAAFESERDFILEMLERPPQTNEVARSSALVGGFLEIASHCALPLEVLEIGASAGLNLHWDRFFYRLGPVTWGETGSLVRLAPQWSGSIPPCEAELSIVGRRGCDRSPLDPTSGEDRLRLRSYVWADQIHRMERLDAALVVAAESGIKVDQADAADWLEAQLGTAKAGRARVVFHTIVWQYLDPQVQARIEALLSSAGLRATVESPLAWLRLEPDGEPRGAALSLTLWPPGEARCIARADFHGRWVDWQGWGGAPAP